MKTVALKAWCGQPVTPALKARDLQFAGGEGALAPTMMMAAYHTSDMGPENIYNIQHIMCVYVCVCSVCDQGQICMYTPQYKASRMKVRSKGTHTQVA